MKPITNSEVKQIAEEFSIHYSKVQAFREVESGGKGFDETTGKIIIQFEPVWFKRKSPYTPSGKWSLNKVERQAQEWEAFNDAFKKDANAAMEACSIGSMQIMGFHYKLLGFKSVGDMWDYAKESEANQVRLGMRFIKANKKLYSALVKGDWKTVAYYYNGEKYYILGYDKKLEKAENKYI